MNAQTLYAVDIELKRVQTFIFEAPRLKAMLGANVLIGEVLRQELMEEAILAGTSPLTVTHVPGAGPDDPLPDDNPAALYRQGILVRDGGRFKALFADETKASQFQDAAERLITERLPGVLFDIKTSPFGAERESQGGREPKAREAQLLDLPVLQICQETGQGVASGTSPGEDKKKASALVLARFEAGKKFYEGRSRDIIGLMREPLGLKPGAGWEDPGDLKDLCAGGYLALIHADGNNVGKRYKAWKGQQTQDPGPLAREAAGETFYHSMRVAVRKALVAALKATFAKKGGKRPYQVLMLGGDDLLLACRADKALEFAHHYAQELKKYPLADADSLDVGIGVAIARHHYPLHRLHELAEALAASAKRLYRADPGKGSVIDWQVVTQSWFDDVAEARRRDDRREYLVNGQKETLLLSSRPYPVLGDGGFSLEQLLDAVKRLDPADDSEAASRSPLRALRTAFESGRLAAKMAFDRLDEPLQKTLAGTGGDSPWVDKGNDQYITRVLDVIGIREIARLGRTKHD